MNSLHINYTIMFPYIHYTFFLNKAAFTLVSVSHEPTLKDYKTQGSTQQGIFLDK